MAAQLVGAFVGVAAANLMFDLPVFSISQHGRNGFAQLLSEVIATFGLDLDGVVPRKLDEDLARRSQMLVTMGCGEACPFVPGLAREDWDLADPRGRPMEEVRAIRDAVRGRVEALVRTHGWNRDGA